MTEQQMVQDPEQVLLDLNVEVNQLDSESWEILTTISKEDFVNVSLSFQKLRSIKTILSKSSGIPVEFLEFTDTQVTNITDDTVSTKITVRRSPPPSGSPKITFRSQMGNDKIEYKDMIADVVIYPMNEFGQYTTLEFIESCLKTHKVSPRLVKIENIEQGIKQSKFTRSVVNGIIGAQGTLPEPATDAKIQFYFELEPDPSKVNEFRTSRMVKADDLLCSKTLPVDGTKEGIDVHGATIPCSKALDFRVIGSNGAKTAQYGLSVTAAVDGFVLIDRTYKQQYTARGERSMLEKVTVSVVPPLELESSDAMSVVTDQPVYIKGDLVVGSIICATGDVIVMGNVQADTSIETTGNILIQGSVESSHLHSDQSIAVNGSVANSSVSAAATVSVNGNIDSSKVIGSTIRGKSATGSKFIAEKSITIEQMDMDEEATLNSIVMGLREFFEARIEENKESIQRAEGSLNRLTELFGQEVIDSALNGTIQVAFLKHVSTWRRRHSRAPLSYEEIELHKNLLSLVQPTKALIKTRKLENIALQKQMIRQEAELVPA